MIKAFFRAYRPSFSLLVFFLGVLFLTLWAAGVDTEILKLTVRIAFVTGILYFGTAFFFFAGSEREERRWERRYEEKNAEWSALKERVSELENYFLLWIHQIKTPVTAAKILLEKTEERSLKEQIFAIEGYADSAMNFVKMMNIYNNLHIGEVPLDAVIRSLIRKYAFLCIEHKITILYSETDASVISDERWLSILIEQIFSNAVKYGRGGSIHIRFEQNVLSVTDEGVGIHAQDIPKIFQMGYTGENGFCNDMSTGVGMYVASKISEVLHLEIVVESEPEKGTTVSIVFP